MELATYQHAGNKIEINLHMSNGGVISNKNTSNTFIRDIKPIGLSRIYRFYFLYFKVNLDLRLS